MNKLLKIVSATGVALALSAGVAFAASGYSLFGDASYVSPGNASSRAVETTSNPAGAGYGGIDFTVPSGLTLADLTNLSTDYKVTAGGCGGGSPRYSIAVQTPAGDKNVFFYIGTPPNYTCPADGLYHNSGNLAAPANLVDATQLGGGFYEPYAQVQLDYGSYPVIGIALVTDGGWAVGGTQTVVFDNSMINTTTYTYEPNVPTSKDQCKNGGYEDLEDANGQPFKNQGQCVSYFNHQ